MTNNPDISRRDKVDEILKPLFDNLAVTRGEFEEVVKQINENFIRIHERLDKLENPNGK